MGILSLLPPKYHNKNMLAGPATPARYHLLSTFDIGYNSFCQTYLTAWRCQSVCVDGCLDCTYEPAGQQSTCLSSLSLSPSSTARQVSPNSPVFQMHCCRFAALPMIQSSVFQLCDLTHTTLQQMLHDPALAACCSEKSGKVPQSLSKSHCPCPVLKLAELPVTDPSSSPELAVLMKTLPVRIGMQAGMQHAVCDSDAACCV